MSSWSDIAVLSYQIKKGTDVMASQYVSYTVQAKCDGQSHTVERRFSEFVLLQKEIAKECQGAIVPPLPKDQMFGRFKPAFIESRMRGLEECLKKMHGSADISNSCCWTPFFTCAHFSSAVLKAEKGGDTLPISSWGGMSSLRTLAAPVLVNPYLDTAEIDGNMNEIRDYINTYAKLMHALSTTAAGLVDTTTNTSRILSNMAETCIAIGCNSNEEDDACFRQFGLSVASLSQNIDHNAEGQLVRVQEPLEQQDRTFVSIKEALLRQKTLKNDFIVRAADKILCEKMEQKDPSNTSKVENSRKSRGAVLTAKEAYLDASRCLLDNFERLQSHRAHDVVCVAEALCEVELAACEKNGHILADLLDDLSLDE